MILQRKKLVLSIVFILFIFNLWQWWPHTEKAGLQGVPLIAEQISADDLRLSGHEIDDKSVRKVNRDLFGIHKIKSSKTSKKSESKKRNQSANKNIARSVKKHQNKSNLSQFRLVAVLFKNGEKYAYLFKGDKDFSVKKGDHIDARYLVKEVTISTVTLIETSTHKSSIVTMQ
jgi:hypothetical protein